MAMNNKFQFDIVNKRSKISSKNDEEVDAKSGSILSDSQSSWVLFNPHESNPAISEILSLSCEGTEIGDVGSIGESSKINNVPSIRDDIFLNDTESNDSLLDMLDIPPSQARLEQLFKAKSNSSLDKRIDQWYNSGKEECHNDNAASWDLDENLRSRLDTSILRRQMPFYGDDLFHNFTRKDYIEFRKVTKKLEPSLTTRPEKRSLPIIIDFLLQNILQQNNGIVSDHLHLKDLRSYASFLRASKARHFADVAMEKQKNNRKFSIPNNKPFSDTASSSSMIRCGGSGGSWDDMS